MIWWTADTATGQLAELLNLPAPTTPIEVNPAWDADLGNMLATTRLNYPSGHNVHNGPADGTFGDVAVVPLVTALIAAQLDANEPCTLDDIHRDMVNARAYHRADLKRVLIEIRARKLIIDTAAELLCSARLAHPSITDGGRYDSRSDIAKGVDLVLRYRCSGPRSLQIKRLVAFPKPSIVGKLLVVSGDGGEWVGPAWVVTRAGARDFVELTELMHAPDRFNGQTEMFA